MTQDEAREELKKHNPTGEYISLCKNYSTLDGIFSAEELRRIAYLMDQIDPNDPKAIIETERR